MVFIMSRLDALKAELKTQTPTADDLTTLGVQYHNATDGKTRDYEKANLCYQEALKLNPNHAHANYNLGLNHRYGQGVAKDLATAKAYYEKAEANGLANAKLRLLEMEMAETKPTPTADDWNALGLQYHNATDGKTRDYEKANLCYQEALKLNPNHAHANYNLGQLYQNGHGVLNNTEEAKKHYRIAKDNGHSEAREKLLEIEQEIPRKIKSDLFPKLLGSDPLTEDEKALCVTHKDIISGILLTDYHDDATVLRLAVNKHSELGKILSMHRKASGIRNLWHHADTATVKEIKAQIEILEKRGMEQTQPTVVTGVPLEQRGNDEFFMRASHTSITTLFGRTGLRAISSSALAYAELFNQCAHNLFSATVPVFTKKTIDAEKRPVEKLNLWKAALSLSERNLVLQRTRENWAIKGKLDSGDVPSHPLPTVESELQIRAEDFNADQGADRTSMKLALV